MTNRNPDKSPGFGISLALLCPFTACGLQWLFWDAYIKPYVWFLFFPAAFCSAWLGGLRGGLTGTAISTLLAWYVFIPPQFALTVVDTSSLASIALFAVMGGLFAWLFERLQRAMRNSEEARLSAERSQQQLTGLYRKTLELDQLKSQFFANVSHELRTPLTLIMAPLEKRLTMVNGDTAERRETEMMLRNARLLYRQVSDLLDAAKLEAGSMQIHYARLDLAELTRTTAAYFDSLANERGIAFVVNVPAALHAEVDAEKVARILLNLLSNAFKFTPDGGYIDLRLLRTDAAAVIEVEDNGPGVPADLREAVFERFRQLEGNADRRHGGTGLGLAIVREFAALHGGSALLGEAPSGGALFSVRLPLTAPAGISLAAASRSDALIGNRAAIESSLARPMPAAAATTADSRDAPLILVVEDNADLQTFIAASLQPYYRVAGAANGRQGVTLALSLMPDLILTDLMMPEMSGDTMIAELRRQPEFADVPILVLSAKADDALRIRLLQAGVQEYLIKPFRVDELLTRVAGLIGERQRIDSRLRESENRFEATFELAAVGIALVAPDGRWLRVNAKLCNIVGYSAAELLAKTFQDITHPDDLAADLRCVRQMLERRIDHYTMEKRYLRKDGSIVWVNLSVSLVDKSDCSPDYFISVVEDISRRKQAEAQLELWREAFEKSEFGVAIGDPATQTILAVNPAFARQRGYSAEELAGKPVETLFPEDCWETVRPRILDADRLGHASFESEHLCKNGERFPVLLDITVTRAPDGKPMRRIGFALDISERKQAERELRRQTEELQHRNLELERFDNAGIDRELAMIRLKQHVNDLAAELGRMPPYDVSFTDQADVPPENSP
ncbi:PAS domain S-box protein [Methylomonas sp. HYX-M1]|uniref:PAS domain S-box protein n=1 Tax=Methylomonas sp. HYX-M1 TaxID=3139307 RepID=UPI00345BB127